MFVVMESSCGTLAPGGYRTSMWNFNRQQTVDLVSHSDLELNQNCVGISLLPQQVQKECDNTRRSSATGISEAT